LIICSPAIHPWYWIVLTPLCLQAGLRTSDDGESGKAAGVATALQLCAPFSYLLYGGAHTLLVFALSYGPPLALLIRPARTEEVD